MRRAADAFLAVALPFLVAAPAGAQVEQAPVAPGVDAVLRLPWTKHVSGGYLPLQVELRSRVDEELTVRLEALDLSGFASDVRVSTEVVLAPRERRAFEMPLLVQADGSPDFHVEIRTTELRPTTAYGFGPESGGAPAMPFPLPPGAPKPTAPSHVLAKRAVVYAAPEPPGFQPYGGATDVAVTVVRFADLPRGFEGYTSLDAAIVDATTAWPQSPCLEALCAYARTGGTLVLLGVDDARVLQAAPSLATWLEPRFRLADLDGVRVQACGAGILVLAADRDLDALLRPFERAFGSARRLVPHGGGFTSSIEAPDLEIRLRLGLVVALLVVTTFVLGPVAFYFVKRSGRPVLLLPLLPSIAAVGTTALVIAGFVIYGTDVRRASRSFTLLDARARLATTVETRAIHAGLAPAAGIRPGARSVCVPIHAPGAQPWQVAKGLPSLTLALDDGALALGGAFLPPRQTVRQLVLSERASRFDVTIEGTSIRNDLPVAIAALHYRDPDGEWFRLEEALPAGATGRLVPLGAPLPADLLAGRTDGYLPIAAADDAHALPPGCWYAVTHETPFRDDGGIDFLDVEDEQGQPWHAIVGVGGGAR